MAEVFLSLGTNLGDKKMNLERAICEIKHKIGTVTAISSIYESKSWGFDVEDSFFNIMIELNTSLEPEQLLRDCQAIEIKLGRIRTSQSGYSSRIIDIDIVYYNNQIVTKSHLHIPHQRMQERNFVLAPLCEIAPTKLHPVFLIDSMELQQKSSDTIQAVRRSDLTLHSD